MTSDARKKSEYYLSAIRVFVRYHLQINYASTKLSYLLDSIKNDANVRTDTAGLLALVGLVGQDLAETLEECRRVKEDVLAPGVRRLDELAPEGRESVLSAILANELAMRAKKHAPNNYGITMRDFCRMKHASDFSAAVLRVLLGAIREAYRDMPPTYSAVIRPQEV